MIICRGKPYIFFLFKATTTTHQLDTTLKKYNLMKTFDKIHLATKSKRDGILGAELSIIKVIDESALTYLLSRDNLIAVGEYNTLTNKWKLSKPIDLLNMPLLINESYHDVTNKEDFIAFLNQ